MPFDKLSDQEHTEGIDHRQRQCEVCVQEPQVAYNPVQRNQRDLAGTIMVAI